MTDYIINEKGQEVISERHQKDFKREDYTENKDANEDVTKDATEETPASTESFTDINFEDI